MLYYFCYIWLFWYSSLNKRYNWFKQKRKLLLWDLMIKQDSVEQYSNDDVSWWADDFCPFVAFLFNRWFVQTDDRKTIPSEFHWWSADPTQSSSHWGVVGTNRLFFFALFPIQKHKRWTKFYIQKSEEVRNMFSYFVLTSCFLLQWLSSELTKVGAQLRIYNSHSLH